MSLSKKPTLLVLALWGAAILWIAAPAEGADQCAPEQAEKMPAGTTNVKVTASGQPAAAVAGHASNAWNSSCNNGLPQFGSSGTVAVNFVSHTGNCPGCYCGWTDLSGTTINSATVHIYSNKSDGTPCTITEQKESGAHELGHVLGLDHAPDLVVCRGRIMKPVEPLDPPRSVTTADCAAAKEANSPPPPPPPPAPQCFTDSNCTGTTPYCVGGVCVECRVDFDCYTGGFVTFGGDALTTGSLPGQKFEGAQFTCIAGYCVAVSPLVVHLPDYTSPTGAAQNWWRDLCAPEASPVCLDWMGNGNITCTGWTAPDNEAIGFVAALSEADLTSLAAGPIPVQPSLHLFGNVTRGPLGDFPFPHGFDALASFCGQPGTAEIDLTACGERLFVWVDNGDGAIAAHEVQRFDTLGVASLGRVRQVGKQDQCGNRALYESHATCVDRPGRCGTWIDIFFAPVAE
jgi:hypothetical protein